MWWWSEWAKPAQVSRSLLLCTNHNRGSDPYVYASADSAQAGCRYQAFLPCVNKKVRGQSTLPHTGNTGCFSKGNPSVSEGKYLLKYSSCSQDLTVTNLYQKTTSHHSETTWDMRHTKCVPVACDAMWCYVMLCDTDSLPATTTSCSFGWLFHIINHGSLQVRSCHQSWSSSLAYSFWLLPLLPSVHQGLSHSLPTPQSCCVTANTSDMHEMEL